MQSSDFKWGEAEAQSPKLMLLAGAGLPCRLDHIARWVSVRAGSGHTAPYSADHVHQPLPGTKGSNDADPSVPGLWIFPMGWGCGCVLRCCEGKCPWGQIFAPVALCCKAQTVAQSAWVPSNTASGCQWSFPGPAWLPPYLPQGQIQETASQKLCTSQDISSKTSFVDPVLK